MCPWQPGLSGVTGRRRRCRALTAAVLGAILLAVPWLAWWEAREELNVRPSDRGRGPVAPPAEGLLPAPEALMALDELAVALASSERAARRAAGCCWRVRPGPNLAEPARPRTRDQLLLATQVVRRPSSTLDRQAAGLPSWRRPPPKAAASEARSWPRSGTALRLQAAAAAAGGGDRCGQRLGRRGQPDRCGRVGLAGRDRWLARWAQALGTDDGGGPAGPPWA